MGKQGRNVKQARDIPGVVAIDFDDFSSMFTIKAEVRGRGGGRKRKD